MKCHDRFAKVLTLGLLAFVLIIFGACGSEDNPAGPATGDDPPQEDPVYELLVSSSRSNSVRRYDFSSGAYLGDFVPPRTGRLRNTQEVLYGRDGSILVTGLENDAILQFDADTGEYLGPFTSGYALQGPTKTTFGPDSMLYVSQWGQTQHKVVRFDGLTGAFVDEFTEVDVIQGMGHVWDAEGNLYVASMGDQSILKFAPDGSLIGTVATVEGGMRPANIWFGTDGDLFVVDWQNGMVRTFDLASGTQTGIFARGMERVEGYAWGPFGSLMLCDWEQGQIVRFNSAGTRIGILVDDPELRNPNSILIRRVK